MLSLVSYSVVLRSESIDVAAAVTSGAPDLVSLLNVVLCDSRRGGRTRSNGKCSRKVTMMDKDLNGNRSNGKCTNCK